MENIQTVEILIAVIVAYIAIQNYRLSKNQLKLQLFEKRYTLYASLKNLFKHINIEAAIDSVAYRVFKIETNEAHWFFDSDVVDYLEEAGDKAWKLYKLSQKLHNHELSTGEERTKAAFEAEETCKWFYDQYESADKIFTPYFEFTGMTLGKIKKRFLSSWIDKK